MGRSSTTWTPKTAPKGKGSRKATKTKIKESIGLDGWDSFTDFIENEGAEKLLTEIKKLKGARYVYAYNAFIEFVKPKLSRTTLEGDADHPIEITINGFKAD